MVLFNLSICVARSGVDSRVGTDREGEVEKEFTDAWKKLEELDRQWEEEEAEMADAGDYREGGV